MSDQIHLVYGNINRTSFSFSISFPHSFRDDSNVLTFGIFASVPEINSFKESITYGIVGDSHCVSKHWVKIWYLHKGHKIVDNFDKESGLFLILWENLRRLVNDTVSFLIVLFDVLFHLINIGLMDQRVRVHHSDGAPVVSIATKAANTTGKTTRTTTAGKNARTGKRKNSRKMQNTPW